MSADAYAANRSFQRSYLLFFLGTKLVRPFFFKSVDCINKCLGLRGSMTMIFRIRGL